MTVPKHSTGLQVKLFCYCILWGILGVTINVLCLVVLLNAVVLLVLYIVYAFELIQFYSILLYCCNRFDWSHDLFMLNLVELNNSFFYKWHNSNLTDIELNTVWSLMDIIFIREGYSVLPANFILTKSQIADIIAGICT